MIKFKYGYDNMMTYIQSVKQVDNIVELKVELLKFLWRLVDDSIEMKQIKYLKTKTEYILNVTVRLRKMDRKDITLFLSKITKSVINQNNNIFIISI